MRKTLQISLLIAIVTLFSYEANSAAQAKAGAQCTKVATKQVAKGKKFTCIKSGNKLVWNKGIAVSAPSPTPSKTLAPIVQATPNPFDSQPFPNVFTRTEMVEAVFKHFDEFMKKTPSVNSFKIIIDANFQSDSTAITKLVSDAYAVLPFPSGYPTTVVILSDDPDLIDKSVKENGFGKGNLQLSGNHCRNCAGYGWGTSRNPLSSVTTHEIFHIWQMAAYKKENDIGLDTNNPLNPPIWFEEGGAEFFSEAFYSKISGKYQSPNLDQYPNFLLEPTTLKAYVSRDKNRSLPYILGRVACEYIVASKGMENYLDIHWNVGKGQDFPTAFKNALGISLENFYESFDRNVKKMFL
jgi:hypothetical protein